MTTRTPYQIPLSPKAQQFFIRLGSKQYFLTWRYNADAPGWMLTIADENRAPLISNLPVVTGLDLLAPLRHLGIEGSLVVQTDNDPDAVPTYENLGTAGRTYFVVTT